MLNNSQNVRVYGFKNKFEMRIRQRKSLVKQKLVFHMQLEESGKREIN